MAPFSKRRANHGLLARFFRSDRNQSVQEQHAELLRGGATLPGPRMLINKGQDDEMDIWCYKTSRVKTALTYSFIVLTLGALRLVFHWIPHWYVLATCDLCNVGEAQKILIKEIFGGKHHIYHVKPLTVLTPEKVRKLRSESTLQNNCEADDLTQNPDSGPTLSVHFTGGKFRSVDSLLMFTCKKVTYIWDNTCMEFVKLHGLDSGVPCAVFHDGGALSPAEHFTRLLVYGANRITVKELSIGTLLFLEVLNPFYIFQIASFILWSLDNYYYYCGAIALMSIFGISMTVRQTRKNQHNLKSTVHSSDVCDVLRKSTKFSDEQQAYVTETVSTDFLVPGDVLVIPPHGCVMHCDAVLLTGNCIINESMLTGESVPVTKTAVPHLSDLIYDPQEHGKHTLFCGTHVIQTRYFGEEKVVAVVVRTGFSTAKGSLVRSILYPPPVDFRFEKDSYKFIVLLAAVAMVGFIYTIITKSMRGVPASDLIVEALDLITIVVPPALPAAMTVGRFYAQIRLKKQQIFCISPRTINVSGSIDCVCFDKTGTLTEDGLDLLCVVPVASQGAFGEPCQNVPSVSHDLFFHGLVSCHSLTIIDKQITGDPLDLKMFESTGWLMEEYDVADTAKFDMMFPTVLKPPKSDDSYNDLQIGIIREFPFSSSHQRMGVIVRKLSGKHFEYYSKGSPEMILNYVDKSTIPKDFPAVLESYTQEGYRVIAMAHKELRLSYAKVNKVQREDIEHDMTFLGLIVLENRLKEDTAPCIQSLNEAHIRVVMVTGDNILTALSVARDCHIVTPGQSVITVNVDTQTPPQIYYTYTNTSKVKNPNDLSVTNSASVVSLDTVESHICSGAPKLQNPLSTALGNNYRFAITGRVWAVLRDHHPTLVPQIVTRGVVYARMSPEQKQQLVQELQELGYVVAMCGDGANDCGALKAAHTGISLSEAESSVASPFTSKNPNIRCVLQVIKEGRAALVTSFGIFKYMAAYSLCQFVSVLILYSIESNLTDMEFLYIDLFIISVFAFFFGKTAAYSGKLVKETPLSSLMSFSPILSLLFQLVLLIGMQVAAFEHLRSQSWYHPFDSETTEHKDDVSCMENFTVFTLSSFQYIILAVVFSKGKPYRQSIFSNWGFLLTAILITTFSVYLALWPSDFFLSTFELVPPPDFNFRLFLIGYALINFVLALFIELVIIDYWVFKKLRFKFHNLDKSKRKYLAIERDLNRNRKWPPLSDDLRALASPEEHQQGVACTAEIVIESESTKPNHRSNKIINKLLEQEQQQSSPSETYKSFSSDSQYNIADLPYECDLGGNCNVNSNVNANVRAIENNGGLELNCLESR